MRFIEPRAAVFIRNPRNRISSTRELYSQRFERPRIVDNRIRTGIDLDGRSGKGITAARAFRLNERGRGDASEWEPFETTLRRLYFDTVLFDQEALELMFKVCGVDRCLFGSDKPANGSAIDPRTGRSLNDVKPLIDAIPWLTEADRRAIYEGNARAVYTRLTRVQST